MASQQPLKKNATATIVFPIYDEDGNLLSGATGLDSEYSLDGGSFSDCASEASEIDATGMYSLALTADETNGDIVAILVKTTSATGKTSALVFYTAGQTLDEMDTVIDDTNSTVTSRLDADITSRAPKQEYDTQLDANMSTRAPASEYDTEMARITANVATEDKQDTMQVDVTAILLDTGTTIPATLTTLESKIDIIDTVVDAILVDTSTTLEDKLTLVHKILKNKLYLDVANSQLILYDDDGTTPLYTWAVLDKDGNSISVAVGVASDRGVPS